MKKVFLITGMILALCAGAAFSQQQQPQQRGAKRYDVIAGADVPQETAAALSAEMENRFAVYNKLFRFNPAAITSPLTVRVFAGTKSYGEYLRSKLADSGAAGAVYLHYENPAKRELVVDMSAADDGALPYQAFVQYLRAFVPEPPSWMKYGFAVFFSGLTAGADGDGTSGALRYEENLAWLDTVKKLKDSGAPLEEILLADTADKPPADVQIRSWALVSFLMNSGSEDYYRALTDSFLVLDAKKSAADNAKAVNERLTMWDDIAAIQSDYQSYVQSRKTFAELMADGQKFYAAGDAPAAELAFLSAASQRGGRYEPYYFLGLLANGREDYARADQYYDACAKYGGAAALTAYARGLNAAAAGNTDDAAAFLKQAADADPAAYKTKAEALLAKLKH